MESKHVCLRYVIVTKHVHHIDNAVTVDVMKFYNFLWSRFLQIMQNVKMATKGKGKAMAKSAVVLLI